MPPAQKLCHFNVFFALALLATSQHRLNHEEKPVAIQGAEADTQNDVHPHDTG